MCPIVVATNPEKSATQVPPTQVIEVTFNTEMNPATITDESFILTAGSRIAGSVSYDAAGMKLIFKPTASLTYSTSYTGRVNTRVKDITGNALQTDYIWSFTTGSLADTLAPQVILTDPDNGEGSVALNKVIKATFNMPMDVASLNAGSMMVKQGTIDIAGAITYSSNTVSFTPSLALAAGTVINCTITAAVKSSMGKNMLNDYVWSFTTGLSLAPEVTSTDPVNTATAVPTDKVITATFSEAMNAPDFSVTTFLLKEGNNSIAGTVSFNGTMASFAPSADLLSGTTYTATIKSTVKNLAGTSLANDYVWHFTTATGTTSVPQVISTNPMNNNNAVPINKVISATFSEVMNAITFDGTTFLLQEGSNSVAGTVSYNGSTASFQPSSDLLNNTTYTATIKSSVTNTSGTSMAADHVWKFTTVAGPTVTPFVDLKTAARFGILAGVGISNNAGFSEIRNLDVGISPGVRSSITGFNPQAIVVNGAIYASDDLAPPGTAAMLIQAKQDLTDSYLFAEGATVPAPATVAGDLGGQTLAPGIYKSNSTLLIQSGDLTLDAGGNPNAFWVFQIASGFTTVGGAGGSVILSGGAQAKNVFWQTGSSATIGDNTSFKGTILALTSITMNSNATATGRMLARNGSVVMTSTNIIEKP